MPAQIVSKELVIMNDLGLHARPAAQFAKTSSTFQCEIWVEKDDERVNGKSIMGLMLLAAGCGSRLLVSAEGEDAEAALCALQNLVVRKFGEGD